MSLRNLSSLELPNSIIIVGQLPADKYIILPLAAGLPDESQYPEDVVLFASHGLNTVRRDHLPGRFIYLAKDVVSCAALSQLGPYMKDSNIGVDACRWKPLYPTSEQMRRFFARCRALNTGVYIINLAADFEFLRELLIDFQDVVRLVQING